MVKFKQEKIGKVKSEWGEEFSYLTIPYENGGGKCLNTPVEKVLYQIKDGIAELFQEAWEDEGKKGYFTDYAPHLSAVYSLFPKGCKKGEYIYLAPTGEYRSYPDGYTKYILLAPVSISIREEVFEWKDRYILTHLFWNLMDMNRGFFPARCLLKNRVRELKKFYKFAFNKEFVE